ncbi:MAG: fucose isomerase [Bacillota bacterium]
MRINVIKLMSPLHGEKRVLKSVEPTMEFLRKNYEVKFVEPGEAEGFTLIWVMTGGVEGKFREIYEKLEKPVVILSEGINNSLAASMEILSYVKSRGDSGYLLYASSEETVKKINELARLEEARSRIKNAVIGSIGGPSDWLIDSAVDYKKASKRWGTRFIDIPMEELCRYIEDQGEEKYDGYFDGAAVLEPTPDDIKGAHRIFVALRKLVSERGLDAVTVKCFDLLGKLKNTGCTALARLNDEGVVAGCEGDLPATFTMFAVRALTGQNSFMANPSAADFSENTVVFAHCTIPTRMVRKYRLRSHFESGLGVAIAGEVQEGPVTVFKIGGEGLDRFRLYRGTLVKNTESEQRCRTQIEVRLEVPVREFLENPLGNHQVIVSGDYGALFDAFMKYMNLT